METILSIDGFSIRNNCIRVSRYTTHDSIFAQSRISMNNPTNLISPPPQSTGSILSDRLVNLIPRGPSPIANTTGNDQFSDNYPNPNSNYSNFLNSNELGSRLANFHVEPFVSHLNPSGLYDNNNPPFSSNYSLFAEPAPPPVEDVSFFPLFNIVCIQSTFLTNLTF